MESKLDFNQLRAFHAFQRGHCVALLGGAGSGKSFLLRRLLREALKKYDAECVMACAWTNQCATAIGGRTIHAWFGVQCGFVFSKENLWSRVKEDKAMCDVLRKVKVLFVDEISVLKQNVLDAVDWVMRHVAESDRLSSIPMGARQLVVAGDPYQLEPIGLNNEIEGEKHVFSARSWFLIFGGF